MGRELAKWAVTPGMHRIEVSNLKKIIERQLWVRLVGASNQKV